MQGKGLFGFVSNAISHQNCRFEVTFTQPGSQEPVPAIHLKAQGKYPAEAYPLYHDASGSSVCGTVRPPRAHNSAAANALRIMKQCMKRALRGEGPYVDQGTVQVLLPKCAAASRQPNPAAEASSPARASARDAKAPTGEVRVQVKVVALQGGQKVDHQGLRIQLVGTIELLKSSVKNHEFLSLCAPAHPQLWPAVCRCARAASAHSS